MRKIIKLSDNKYRVSGTTEIRKPKKEIEIDGILYESIEQEYEEFDIDKYWETNSEKWMAKDIGILNFLIGDIKVFYPELFFESIIDHSIFIQYSEEPSVKIVSHIIDDHGIGEKYNIWRYFIHKDYDYWMQKEYLMESTIVSFPIYEYGWNNKLYLAFALYDFLRLDIRKLKDISKNDLKKLFKNIIDDEYFEDKELDDRMRRKIALIILQNKINYKKQKSWNR